MSGERSLGIATTIFKDFSRRAGSLRVAFCLGIFLVAASFGFGQTSDTWNGGSGNWSNPANWSGGVPNGDYNVFIDGGNLLASAVTLDMNATVNNLTVDSDDSLAISDNQSLTVTGSSISNAGNISLNSGNDSTKLVIGSSSVTLSGGGTLTMGNNPANVIVGSAGNNVFNNQETIQGAGNIGDGQMTLVNSGTINANTGAGQNPLIIQTSGGTTNTGTLEATNGSTLVLTAASGGNITNTGGTISAAGSGSVVALESGITITGGTLTTTGNGIIETPGGHTATLNGLTNSGTYVVSDNSTTILEGAITNNGSIQLNSGNDPTNLKINGNVTLAGSGNVTMSNNPANIILGTAGGNVLTNQETIQGAGNIGDGQMTLLNSGTINANAGAGQNALIIQTSGGTTNTGTIEATNGSTLVLTGASGGNFTNTGGTIQAVGSTIDLQSGVTITGGTLTTSSGGVIQTPGGNTATLSGVTTSGTYNISDNSTTILQGTITNTGSIQLNSGNDPTNLKISGNVTLAGSGNVTMGNNAANLIIGNSTGTEILTNKQTIQGAGNIGGGFLTLANQGIVNANAGFGQNPLIIQPGSGGVTNTGTLESTNGSTLILNAGTFTNTNGTRSGTIQAVGANSVVLLENGVTVAGGTLTDSGGGLIETPGGHSATLDGTTHTLTNAGTFSINDSSTTTLLGTINNTGSFQLNSGNNPTFLKIGNATNNVTLTGGGSITMGNNSANLIVGTTAGDTLTNVNNTIQGSGNIGDGQLTFINQSLINANTGNGQNQLVIQTSGGTTNTGTIEATNGSTLVLTGASGGNFTNTGGTIEALNSTVGTSVVSLQGGVTITGGTLTTTGNGIIETPGGNSATLNGLTNSGIYNITDNSTTILKGTITNNGSILLSSGNDATKLQTNGNVTLTGSGSVTMGNNSANIILGTAGSDVLTNQETIQGAGNIGDGQVTLINSGTINANTGSGQNPLVIQTSGGTTNTGTIEATNGSTLVLTGLNGGNFTNTGGTIQALGSTIALENGVSITGGNLATSSGGVIETPGGHSATLANLTNSGTYSISDNSTTILQGTITNNGSIQLNSGNDPTNLKINGNVTLAGSGNVTMSNNPANFILGTAGGNVLTNQETIQGAGNIGDGVMTLINSGTINANAGAGQNALIIQTSGGTTNTGTIEATNGSTLVLTGASGGNFTNTGGTIEAVGSTIDLQSGVTIAGGTLTTHSGGVIQTPGGHSATLANLTNSGMYSITDNSTTILQGTITNTGSIQLNSGNDPTDLKISGNVTLAGLGTVTMGNNNANVITGNSTGTEILTSANTIQGAGNIGNGFMGFVNTGKVIANQSNILYIDTDSRAFNNKGTVQANTGSTLEILGPAGSFTNFNSSTNILTGGTYIADGTIQFGTSNATANDIVTNAANITLSGTSSQILDQFGGNALAGFNTNAAGGSFTINGSRNFTTAGNFTNNGTLSVGGGSKFLVNGNLTNFSATTLKGGIYNLTGTLQFNNANIVNNAANITLTGPSAKIINQNGANALTNFAVNAAAGKFTVAGTRTFTTRSNFTNNGTLTTSSSSSKFDVNGSLTNFSGTTLTGGTYNMTGTLQFNGANIVSNAANITLTGTSSQIIDQLANNGLANFATNASGASFTINGGRNFTTAGDFTNNGILTVGSTNSTFAVNGNLTNFSSTTLTGGTYNLTGTLQFNGANIVTNAANLTLTGASAQIIDQSANNALANFSTNASTGSFTINGNRTFTTAGSFTNAGSFTVASGSTFTIGGSGSLTQSGGTTTDDGTLSVGSLFNVQAGSLLGKGTVSGNVQSSGIITPGDSSTATGILKDTGTYTQNSNGTLDISIGGTTAGTKYDELNPTAANLNGTLNISLINGFVPTVGSTFDIMNYKSETGTFSTVNGLSINSSEHFTITYQGNDVVLAVVSGPMKQPAMLKTPSTLKGGVALLGLPARYRLSDWNHGMPSSAGASLSALRQVFRTPFQNMPRTSPLAAGSYFGKSGLPSSFSPAGLRWNARPLLNGSNLGVAPASTHVCDRVLPIASGLPYISAAASHIPMPVVKIGVTASIARSPAASTAPAFPAHMLFPESRVQGIHFDHVIAGTSALAVPAQGMNSFVRRPVSIASTMGGTLQVQASVAKTIATVTQLPNFTPFLSTLQSMRTLTGPGTPASQYRSAAYMNGNSSVLHALPHAARANSNLGSSLPNPGRNGIFGGKRFAVSLWNLNSKPKLGLDIP